MSAAQRPSLLPPLRRPSTWLPPIQVQPPLASSPVHPEEGRIVFTRQLWQRTMPEESTEHGVSNRSHSQASASHIVNTSLRRRASSNVSSRSLRGAASPSGGSKTPLTPEGSPPFTFTRKRTASIAEREDKELVNSQCTPAHTRASSGGSAAQVCLCQPDPKIPRPRNAFILYRQHHQANVVSQHPGLANPDISKIIGEQWRNQPNEVKNEWKALAEEEKLRHQQTYPTYRYQPKRNGRRSSTSSEAPRSATSERPKCNKCGGRTIIAPSTPYTNTSAATSPLDTRQPGTPGAGPTPMSRTLPILHDLSLQSPAVRRMRQYNMSPNQHHDEGNDIGALSPDSKRRCLNGEHPSAVNGTLPLRYGTGPPQGMPVGPGTPFPFGPSSQQPTYSHAQPRPQPGAYVRRESLPGLRGIVSSPGPMPPPPRPGMGYQQHRVSQGHNRPDRSLVLPPLQTGNRPPSIVATPRTSVSKSIETELSFRYKLDVLRQIAPPAPINKPVARGPLISIEGENTDAVLDLSKWLADSLARENELTVRLMEGPDVNAKADGKNIMAEYHSLAAHWLERSEKIAKQLQYNPIVPPQSGSLSTADHLTTMREVEENYDENDSTPTQATSNVRTRAQTHNISSSSPVASFNPEAMDVDLIPATAAHAPKNPRPLTILPLFSLHATNTFTSRIPVNDSYTLKSHWEWSAAQWRGVVGPDLTIYVSDSAEEKGKLVEQSEEERLVVVRRVRGEDGAWEVDGKTLRRVGFEVGEWVRGFAGRIG